MQQDDASEAGASRTPGLLVSVLSARKAAWVGHLLLGPALKDGMRAWLPPGAVSV